MAETETREKAPARARRPTRSKRAVQKLVSSYYDALASRDPDAIAAHWADDGVHEVVPLGVFRGREAVRSLFQEMVSAVPDVETTMQSLVADTQRAAVEWRLTGSFEGGPFRGIDATGRRIELKGLDLLEVKEGKIVRSAVYYDGAEFARQVGMLPPQDSGADRAMKGALNTVTRVRKALNERRSD